MRARPVHGILTLLLLALLCVQPAVAASPEPVLQIKAAFVLNFFTFTDWPPAVHGEQRDDLLLAVVGQGAGVTALEEALAHKTAHGRTVRLLTFADATAVRTERRVVTRAARPTISGWPMPPSSPSPSATSSIFPLGSTICSTRPTTIPPTGCQPAFPRTAGPSVSRQPTGFEADRRRPPPSDRPAPRLTSPPVNGIVQGQ